MKSSEIDTADAAGRRPTEKNSGDFSTGLPRINLSWANKRTNGVT